MIQPNEIEPRDEINKAIGALKARIDSIMNNTMNADDFPEATYNALCLAVCCLEEWRDEDSMRYFPEIARQLIWLKQVKQLEA